MKQKNVLLVGLIIMLLGVNTATVLALDNEGNGFSTQQYQAPIVEESEMLPDPLLNDSQVVIIEGAADNFEWAHTLATEGNGYNNLSLIWNHTAGDSINFRSPTSRP